MVELGLSFLSADFLVKIEYMNYRPGHPGRTSGPPEDCFPPEGPSFDWEVTALQQDLPGELVDLEMPAWLAKELYEHIYATHWNKLCELIEEAEHD